MLFKYFLNTYKNMKKIICILLIILILSSLVIFSTGGNAMASYSNNFSKYPGYEELLKELQAAHPNWEFEILETGLEWSNVIKAETVARHGRSLIERKDKEWHCSICGEKKYESRWYCASEAAVSYYMDPRNFINEDYIFQFEQLTYDEVQTKAGVEKILTGCNYMQGTIKYYDSEGQQKTINKTYIDVIMEAAKTYNVSPYHLASRIRQEMGIKGSTIISGTWVDSDGTSYKGLYNYYNWGAYGSNIIKRGLQTAREYGWTDPEKAIKGGAELLAKNYISKGQDTLYLQKFDVVNGGDGYYGHQYMTNIAAPKSEAGTVRTAYQKVGMLTKDSKMKFKIPVYKNMPSAKCSEPGMESIVTEDVAINTDNVNIRDNRSATGNVIATLKKDTKLVRIEISTEKDSNGNTWDKVVLSDGSKGYVETKYLTKLSLQSNCNQKNIVVDYTNFRNGPGIRDTKVIKLLSPGQILTVLETGKYPNLDRESWVRVRLSDGKIGYIGTGYTPSTPTIQVYDEGSNTYDRVKVVCGDGLNVRSKPDVSDNYNIIKTLRVGTVVTRTQKNASTNGGYIWDKITTSEGIVGYLVRQDKETGKAWIEPVENEMDEISGSGFQSTDKNLVCEPGITVDKIKQVATDVVIKKGSTVIKDTDPVGTGYTITNKGRTFEIIVIGDVNGDGKVNTGDTLTMSQHVENYKKITADDFLKAADVNGDGKINTGDTLCLRQHVEKFKEITYQ